jgi:hypothetical protein
MWRRYGFCSQVALNGEATTKTVGARPWSQGVAKQFGLGEIVSVGDYAVYDKASSSTSQATSQACPDTFSCSARERVAVCPARLLSESRLLVGWFVCIYV